MGDTTTDAGTSPAPLPFAADPIAPPTPAPPPGPTSDPLVDQMRDSQRLALRETLRQAVGHDPDKAATILKLATATRLHPSTVAEVEGDAKAAVAVEYADVDGLMRDHPEVAGWLLDQNNARVGHDDLPGLRNLDAMVRQVTAGPNDDRLGILPRGYQFDGRGGIQRVYSEGHFADQVGDYQGLASDLQRTQQQGEQVDIQTMERDQRVGAQANPFLAGALGALGGDLQALQTIAGSDTSGLRSQLGDIAASSAEQHPGLLNDATRLIGGLTADVPLLLTGAPVAKAAHTLGVAAATMRALSPVIGQAKAAVAGERAIVAASMAPFAARSGINSGTEHGFAYGATDALINLAIPAGFGRVGVQRALTPALEQVGKGGIEAALPAASFLLKQSGLDATQNATLELATAIHEYATGADPQALDPSKLVPRLGLAAAAGGAMGAAFNLPEAARIRAARQGIAIRQAQSEADALSAAVDASLASKTVQRAPEQAAELVKAVVDATGGSGHTVYLQPDEFQAHFQGRGEDPAAVAKAMGVDEATYAAAMSGRSPLPIPLEGFLTRAREEDKPLLDHAMLRPDGLTRAEAGVASEALRKSVEDQVAGAAKAVAPDQATSDASAALDESAQRVGETVEAQLLAAGRKPTEAKYGALLWQKASRQLAERWNADAVARGAQPLTPEGILQRYHVQVTGERATMPEAVARTLHQEAATVAPRDTSLAFGDLRRQWQKAHGDRRVDTSTAEWSKLVEDSARIDASNGRVYFQPSDQAPRGRISVGKDRSLSIELLKKANASTFLHETGHAYLEILSDLGSHPDTAAGIKEDLATVRAWLGSEEGKPWTEAQHEQFARGFERYLMEGKSPSKPLRAAFAAFARWLTNLYKDLSGLRVELTPDVRRVFDKLLASEGEIAAAAQELKAEPFFVHASDAGMTPAEHADYLRAIAEAQQRANDALRGKLMTFERSAAVAEREQAETEARDDITRQVDARPDIQAITGLQDGALPAGITVPEGTKLKLRRDELVARYGADALKALPGPADDGVEGANAGRRLYTREGGMSLDEAAILFGYRDGDALWQALLNAPDREATIALGVKQEMARRFPEPVPRGDLRAEASAALADELGNDVVGREVDALSRQAGTEPTPRELIRAAAERTVATMRAYTLRPEAYRAAAERAALKQFARQQDLREATGEKRAEVAAEVLQLAKERLTNLELYAAAKRAADASATGEAWIKRRDTLDGREKMGKAGGWEFTVYDAYGQAKGAFPTEREALAFTRENPGTTFDRTSSYLDQWDAIMEGFSLKRASNKALRRRESLRQWVDRLEADGEPVVIDDQVIEDLGRKRWQELTVEAQRTVVDALKNVHQLATLKNRLLAAKRKRDLEAVATELAASIEKHATGTVAPRLGTTAREKVAEGVYGFLASHRRDSYLARAMDGYEDGGAVWDAIIRPRNEAAAEKSKRQAESAARRDEDLRAWDKTTSSTRDEIPGTHLRLTHEQRIGMALHWGNREGRQRILADLARQDVPGTEADVRAVLDTLDAGDWKLVKATWKQLASHWHETRSLDRRTTGIESTPVDTLAFATRHGVMEGGYYPIKYDQTQGSKATNIDDATDAKSKLRAANLASTTRRGFTKQRADMVQGRGLRYDFGVVAEHLNEVIHDLTHRELLQDQNRIFRHATIAEAIVKHYGKRALDELVNTTADIAQGEAPAKSAAERFARKVRQGTSAALFTWNLTSALANGTGILQAVPRVGVARTLQALAHVTGDAVRMHNALAEVESRSEFMATRARTWLREVAEANASTTARGKLDAIQRVGYWPMTQVQRVVDAITWHAGHDLGLESAAAKGLTGKDAADHAVQIADQTVIDTQGSGRVGDLPAIMRGGEVSKFFTAFYGYFSTTYNLAAESVGRAVRKGEILQLATNALMVWALPAVLTDLIGRSLRGDTDAYDWKKLAKSEASYGLGMLVGFRELSGAVQGYSYSGPGSLGMINRAYQLAQQAGQGQVDAGLLKATLGAGLAPFGLPALEAQRLVDAWAEASDRGDFAAGLRTALFGKPRH